jgi:hypothetical protein
MVHFVLSVQVFKESETIPNLKVYLKGGKLAWE